MYPRGRVGPRGLSGIDFTSSVNSNGGTSAQAAALNVLSNSDTATPPASDYGNLPPQYAGLVMHADGTLGPPSDANIGSASDPANSAYAYWQGVFKSNRYVTLLNAQNQPLWSVGAISAPAAAAVLATYIPVPGSTTGQLQPTSATAGADQGAQKSTTTVQATTPVAVSSQPNAPVSAPKIYTNDADAVREISAVIGTAAQVGYDGGSQAGFVTVPINGSNVKLFYLQDGTFGNGSVVYTAAQVTAYMNAAGLGGVKLQVPSTPIPATPVAPPPLSTSMPSGPIAYIDPSSPVMDFDPGVNPPDAIGMSPVLQAAVGASAVSVPSWAWIVGAAGLAYVLFRPRRG